MITLPLTADLDARALLGRVQASHDQTAHARPVQLPAGAPPVPAELVERIAQARFLASELRPLVDQMCATYEEAATLVGSSFGPSVDEDKPCEDFSRAIGASQLGAMLDELSDQLGAGVGPMSPEREPADRDPERPEGAETVWRVADRSEWRVGPDARRTVVRPAAAETGGRIVVTNGEWAAE